MATDGVGDIACEAQRDHSRSGAAGCVTTREQDVPATHRVPHAACEVAPTDRDHPRPDVHAYLALPCRFPHRLCVFSVIDCKFFPCIPTAVGGQPASGTADVTIHRRCKCFSPVGWCSPPAAGTVEVTIHRRLRWGGFGATCHHTAAGAWRQWRWRCASPCGDQPLQLLPQQVRQPWTVLVTKSTNHCHWGSRNCAIGYTPCRRCDTLPIARRSGR